MGIFGGVDSADFEKFKAAIQERISQVEKKVVSSASESSMEAAAAARSALESKVSIAALESEIRAAAQAMVKAKESVSLDAEAVSSSRAEYQEDARTLKAKATKAISLFEQMESSVESSKSSVEVIEAELNRVKELLEYAQEIPPELETLKKHVIDANAQAENIKSLLSHSLKRKGDLDELHKEVFGHTIEDESGETQRVDGLKDELEKAYDDVSQRIDNLNDRADDAVEKVAEAHDTIRSDQAREFGELLSKGSTEVDGVVNQLKSLLPGALAAGLSAAYEKKKDEEVDSSISHEKRFRQSIYGLIVVSIIPFAVDTYLLVSGVPLVAVLKDTPRLIVSILPLYLPVLWLAYSANKRLNLSKRLIEEYTHKAVLGKTFSGLSNQIDSLPHENAVKEELRTKLLFNVLQVSAENPGKLITDYNKSDHPLMDVLERSARLSESVDALSKIPGFSGVAKRISDRRDALLREQERKIEDGLTAAKEIEGGESEVT